MKKSLRAVGTTLLIALLAGIVPGTTPAGFPTAGNSQTDALPPFAPVVPPAVFDAITEAETAGEELVELDLMAGSAAEAAAVAKAVTDAGGQVVTMEQNFVRTKVPAAAATTIIREQPVAVGVNESLALETADEPVQVPAKIDAQQASLQTESSLSAMHVGPFRSEYGAQGRGTVVAVIDTGIDPGHPDLQRTPDGQRKIIDWKDFTNEGFVLTKTEVDWTRPLVAPDGRTYTLPQRPAVSRGARFGQWEEYRIPGVINQDLDQNGRTSDRFGVLLVDAAVAGRFDTVYIDSNNNARFDDEAPLRLFAQSGDIAQIGQIRTGPAAARRLNVTVADINPDGRSVSLGFDGAGHGTQVAGVLGAYSASGMNGTAPGVQIMALKAVRSNGVGDWFRIKDAITYAATHGASIINVSIGGLNVAAKADATASAWLDQIARKYGTLIVLAADNSGPGLSSGTTLGSPTEVMAVGSYYSPAMWRRDFGKIVPHDSIWTLSGMGPRSDGAFVPSVVAPGGSPTTSPRWINETGYTTAVGTSVAAPHASGAAALLMEAGRRRGTQSDWLSVKRAMELGAEHIPGFGVYEQGYGLVSLLAAFGHLRQMNSLPALSASTQGLFARSFDPGSSSFWITNMDSDLARVAVFSTESWVRPTFSSLTLPTSVARELPLQMTPPTDHGVHSSFVIVNNLNKYGPSLTIPITHVHPYELTPATNYALSKTDRLEVARYRRYFIQVPAGARSLQVAARVLANQGTVSVHVFRPDGRSVYSSDTGRDAVGRMVDFTTQDPVAGVWEVVVSANPDSRGDILEALYSIDARLTPGPVAEQPLRWTAKAGESLTVPVDLRNVFGPFIGKVEATGLTKVESGNATSPLSSVPWRVERRTATIVEDFTVKEPIRVMRVEIDSPIPASTDLNLYVWFMDPVLGPQRRGTAATEGSSREFIELTDLPPGRYQTQVIATGPNVPGLLQYQYRRLMGTPTNQVLTADDARRHERNEVWTPAVAIVAPAEPGRYSGHLVVWDTEGKKTLGWIPFEISVGQPALKVEPLVPQLVRGTPGRVVLELREPGSGRLVDGTIAVNGHQFMSRNGQITVPVTPQGTVQTLDVEVNLPAYQYSRTQINVPVHEGRTSYPLGVDSSEENSRWRRKVMEQLP